MAGTGPCKEGGFRPGAAAEMKLFAIHTFSSKDFWIGIFMIVLLAWGVANLQRYEVAREAVNLMHQKMSEYQDDIPQHVKDQIDKSIHEIGKSIVK